MNLASSWNATEHVYEFRIKCSPCFTLLIFLELPPTSMDLLCTPISPLQYIVLQSYGRLNCVNNLEIPVDELESLQSFLIIHLLESRHFSEYPPATSYQRSFWKYIISVLEAGGEVSTALIWWKVRLLIQCSGSRRTAISAIYRYTRVHVSLPFASYQVPSKTFNRSG